MNQLQSCSADSGPEAVEPTVSTVMIVRNCGAYLSEAIESLRSQTLPSSEVVVIDGASSDGSAAIAESFGLRVETQLGTGIGQARNQGIAASTGKYLAFLDCDDLWDPTKLESQVAALEADPAAGFVISELALRPADPSNPEATNAVFGASLRRGPVRGLTPSALLVKRELFATLGLFNTDLELGADMDWFVRATDADIPMISLAEVLVTKRLHQNNSSTDVRQNRADILKILRESIRRKRNT